MAITVGTVGSITPGSVPVSGSVTLTSNADGLLVMVQSSPNVSSDVPVVTFDPGGGDEVVKTTPVINENTLGAHCLIYLFSQAELPAAGTFDVSIDVENGSNAGGYLLPIDADGAAVDVQQVAGNSVEPAGAGTLTATFAEAITAGSLVAQIGMSGDPEDFLFPDLANVLTELDPPASKEVGGAYEVSPSETQAYEMQVVAGGTNRMVTAIIEIAAASSAIELMVGDATHAHAAESPSLIQASALAVNAAVHTQTADTPALVQAHILAVQDALHAHNVDSVSLNVAAVLAIADALHAHGADNVVLSVATVVVVNAALHAHSVDNLALLQAHLLAVADATHGHASDAIDLVQGHLLSVADSVHVHTADAIALTQDHLLIVSSALHAHLAEQIRLQEPGFVNAPGRTFVVEASDRVFVVEAKDRTFVVARGNRTFQA